MHLLDFIDSIPLVSHAMVWPYTHTSIRCGSYPPTHNMNPLVQIAPDMARHTLRHPVRPIQSLSAPCYYPPLWQCHSPLCNVLNPQHTCTQRGHKVTVIPQNDNRWSNWVYMTLYMPLVPVYHPRIAGFRHPPLKSYGNRLDPNACISAKNHLFSTRLR